MEVGALRRQPGLDWALHPAAPQPPPLLAGHDVLCLSDPTRCRLEDLSACSTCLSCSGCSVGKSSFPYPADLSPMLMITAQWVHTHNPPAGLSGQRGVCAHLPVLMVACLFPFARRVVFDRTLQCRVIHCKQSGFGCVLFKGSRSVLSFLRSLSGKV